ncbi:MAG: insulinase family protein [Gemmatimonadota bacterium]
MKRGIWLGVLLCVLGATTARGQTRIEVLTEPGTPVVATEFLLTVGPADEPNSKGGVAYLGARAVIAQLQPVLDSLGARVAITPQKDALSFSIVSAPEVWEEATEEVVRGLFRESADSVIMERERRSILAELRGRTSNPADAAVREMDNAFFGADHPWGRPIIGTAGSIATLTYSDIDEFLRAHFTPDRALAVVVGPVDAPDARQHLRPLLGSTFPPPVEVIPYRSAGLPIHRDYNSITTWLTASFRFPETADEEAVRFIAYLAAEEISFSLRQRSVYNVSSEVVPRVGSGEIRLQVVVPPEEAEAWSDRVEGMVETLIDGSMPPDVFAGHRRRFYGQRLASLLAPEDRAHAAVRQLFVRGRLGSLVPDPLELTEDSIREAARSLETPAIVLLGPI